MSGNGVGRLQHITHRNETTRYTWGAAGRLDGKTLPNGIVTDYDWDPAGRLTKLTHSSATGAVLLEYGYNADGRRTPARPTAAPAPPRKRRWRWSTMRPTGSPA